jgi:hypothetical protein
MATIYIEARTKGRQEGERIEDYVVEDHVDHVLAASCHRRRHDYEAGHAKRTQPHPVRAHAQGVARDRSHEQRYHRCGDQAENEVEQLHAATIACPPMSAHPPFGTLAQGQEPGCTRREARG